MNRTIKFVKQWTPGMLIFVLAAGLLTGCHSSSHTSVTQTTAPSAAVSPVATTTTTTVNETHVEDHDYGLFGGIFHVVGEVIAFPFELIANLFRFIF